MFVVWQHLVYNIGHHISVPPGILLHSIRQVFVGFMEVVKVHGKGDLRTKYKVSTYLHLSLQLRILGNQTNITYKNKRLFTCSL